MQLFIKQFTGKTISLHVEPDIEIAMLYQLAYEKRADGQREATLKNYVKVVKFIFAGRNIDYNHKLSDYRIREYSTINEILNSFTMTPDFSFETLSMNDPITLTDMEDPYVLNVGCGHAFEKSELINWIQKKIVNGQIPDCPMCRTTIETTHIDQLQIDI